MFSRPFAFACTCALAVAPGISAQTSARDSAPAPDTSEVKFSGEILVGQTFEREVGHDMLFRLQPLAGDMGGGWVIEIVPKEQPADGPIEFAAIATPPYHFYNQRYLAGAYGYSAHEAVAITPRTFYFVQSVADERAANEVVNAGLYPATVSDQEKDRIAIESTRLQLGRGQLRIVRSRVSNGKAGESDSIAWLKFDVVLNFSPGVTLEQVLAPKPPPAP
jgi:hypothetical protein